MRRSDYAALPTRESDAQSTTDRASTEPRTTLAQEGVTIPVVGFGLLLGGLLTFSNMYFGLQTGWVTMGSLQSALLGFGLCRLFKVTPFGPQENAVAAATMPLAAGFVSVIPALKQLTDPIHLSIMEIFLWTFGIAFFGVFFAVPLRKEVIIREKLTFPSGTATAEMIAVLNKSSLAASRPNGEYDDAVTQAAEGHSDISDSALNTSRWTILAQTFCISGTYELLSYFIPILKQLPVFGNSEAPRWGWFLTPSTSYVGQGMIMGFRVASSQMAGALFGWLFLGPIVKSQGWATDISNAQTGVYGWLIWLSLAIIFAESIVSLGILTLEVIHIFLKSRGFSWYPWSEVKALSILTIPPTTRRARSVKETAFAESAQTLLSESETDDSSLYRTFGESTSTKSTNPSDDEDYAPAYQQVPLLIWLPGLVLTSVSCVVIATCIFHIDFYEPLLAVLASLLVSIIAIRALGQTDLNPVSGVGKLAQLVFSGIAPGNIVSNLVAGGIAEAGAQQAGDMMQDLKTGYLLRSSPRAQFLVQVIGSFFSIFFAVGAWYLYNQAYEIPGPDFQAPSATLWLNMSKFLTDPNTKLPDHLTPFCIAGGIVAAILPLIEKFKPHIAHYLPSAVAFAIGMYLSPNWTIPRFAGSLIQVIWQKYWPQSHSRNMLLVASGLVLGEGLLSIVSATFASLDVPVATCFGCDSVLCKSCH